MSTKSELFPSRWFKADDIPDAGLPVRIDRVGRERIGTEQKDKPIVYFERQANLTVSQISTPVPSRATWATR
jgi:hypothetical protein